MDFKSFLKTRWATWVLAIVLTIVMVFAARILVSQYQVNKEISRLEQQTEKIKKDNDQLSFLIQYLKTPDYEEKQARDKLNLKKDGEIVVSLPPADNTDLTPVTPTKESNTKKWFDYFFNN